MRIANRSALHFVYYSTTKKAAFHLRKRVRGALPARRSARGARRSALTASAAASAHTDRARIVHDCKKHRSNKEFLCISELRAFAVCNAKPAPTRCVFSGRIDCRRIAARIENFLHRQACLRGSQTRNRSKTSESPAADSPRAILFEREQQRETVRSEQSGDRRLRTRDLARVAQHAARNAGEIRARACS